MKSTPANDFFELLEALYRARHRSLGVGGKIVRYLASGGAIDSAALTPRETGTQARRRDTRTRHRDELSISVATVKFHMSNILNKLHLENRPTVAFRIATAHTGAVVSAGEPARSVVEPTT